MEYYNGKLCVTYDDLAGIATMNAIQCIVKKDASIQARKACRSNPALFDLDRLPLKFQLEVYRRRPDLKAQAESKPFVESVEPDGAALDFYQRHQFGDGKYLSTDKQTEYANNAAVLNAFRLVLERSDSQHRKQSKRCISKAEFWRKAAQALPRIADTFPHTLPENPRRLQEKFNQYVREGYGALITGKYGTRNAAKIDDDTKESLLIRLISDARNLDNAQIARIYNVVAETQGWKTITGAAVGVWREKHDLVTAGGRLGETRFRNQRSMQVKRSRPTAPLLYWTMDGWVSELLYQKTEEKNGRTTTTYTHRLTVVIVLDPCINYPVGYAIGERETPELIKAALRNAANHTAELFGRRYYSNQIQSDNYGRGNLKPIYQIMGDIYTPARAHNAKSKVIEPFFNYFNRKYCQLCTNWGGFGITSNKDLQPNSEFLNKHRHSFPTEEECRQQLTAFIERERAEKRAEYVRLFDKLPEERRLPLSDEQYLLTFGADTGYRNALEGVGLRPTIGGIKRDYDCFDPKFREYAHVRWAVKYDPDNLDHVLAVNEDGSLRFMLERKHVQPMALADRREGDAEQLARVREFNKQLENDITERLALASNKVEQLFNDNPQLDVATRLLLCDSRGQNKNHKQTRRLQAHEIEDIEAIKSYAASNRNVYNLSCSEYWNRKHFMAELLQCMGIDSTGCTVPEMMSDIILALKKKETPLVVLDEADKLSDQVLYFFISLYNKLEDRVGIILCATDYLEKRIKKGVRTNRKGYKEIYSRVGRKFIPIQVVNSEDVAAVCIANGVTDPETINEIIDDCESDLRRVKRKVHAVKQRSTSK